MKIIAILLLIIFAIPTVAFPEKTFDEYAVKAALLERISNYIEWPHDKNIDDPSKPFIINVIGDNPFIVIKKGKTTGEDWLSVLYKEQKIKERKVEIRYIKKIEDIPCCHILFVSHSMKTMLPRIVEVASQYPLLTVADSEGFAKKGIHINLYIENRSPKYEINEIALKASALTVRYQLLEWGKIINPLN
ncbi:MAG: YfiR family protein [Acidobacteria bacterium]|jgi:hypothetical protein|nr:YfiR family protein [Acidobacteriota bacterium]